MTLMSWATGSLRMKNFCLSLRLTWHLQLVAAPSISRYLFNRCFTTGNILVKMVSPKIYSSPERFMYQGLGKLLSRQGPHTMLRGNQYRLIRQEIRFEAGRQRLQINKVLDMKYLARDQLITIPLCEASFFQRSASSRTTEVSFFY